LHHHPAVESVFHFSHDYGNKHDFTSC